MATRTTTIRTTPLSECVRFGVLNKAKVRHTGSDGGCCPFFWLDTDAATAADFRDRVVHHLVVNKLNPLFEKIFIHDSYACRKGKGTHFGIQGVDRFIRQCSKNYTTDCYVLKLDVKGFFMAMS
ncbi:MAG: hypothetical protein ACJAWL_002207 [Motiliproteus sp.]|jgi:hypothetical protein